MRVAQPIELTEEDGRRLEQQSRRRSIAARVVLLSGTSALTSISRHLQHPGSNPATLDNRRYARDMPPGSLRRQLRHLGIERMQSPSSR